MTNFCDSTGRVLLPRDLVAHSKFKGQKRKKIVLTFEDEGIQFYPLSEYSVSSLLRDGKEIVAVRILDDKNRIAIPRSLQALVNQRAERLSLVSDGLFRITLRKE